MASGTTSNLGLSQWAAEDFVRREDFNGDNQTLDEVIGLLRGKELASITTAEGSNRIQLDVSDIDWKKYVRVDLDMTIKTQTSFTCYLRANTDSEGTSGNYTSPGTEGSTGKGLTTFSSFGQSDTPGIVRVMFFPLKSDYGAVSSLTLKGKSSWAMQFGYASGQYYSNFHTIYITPSSSSNSFLAGSKFTIRGYEI